MGVPKPIKKEDRDMENHPIKIFRDKWGNNWLELYLQPMTLNKKGKVQGTIRALTYVRGSMANEYELIYVASEGTVAIGKVTKHPRNNN